jgi:hypothetical protein
MALSRSAQYYRDNPEARKKKATTDKKVNARPEQRKKRAELVKERRERGIYGKGGKDVSHQKDGSTRLEDKSKNRGNGSRTAGDRKARGKKK